MRASPADSFHVNAASAPDLITTHGGDCVMSEADVSEGTTIYLGANGEPVDPTAVVGRRITIRWAGDQWYSGTVSEYHASNGQFTITYDDGDVKNYHLSDKTAVWGNTRPAAANTVSHWATHWTGDADMTPSGAAPPPDAWEPQAPLLFGGSETDDDADWDAY